MSAAEHQSLDSFAREFYRIRRQKEKRARRRLKKQAPKKQNFNYLNIDTAEKVTQLIEFCQDSFDEDFLAMAQFRKTIRGLLRNKRM